MRPWKLAAWLLLVGTLAALNYASRFASGKPPPDTLYRYGTAISGAIFYAITLAIVLRVGRGLPPEQLGLRSPRSWRSALGFTLVVLVALFVAEAALESILHATREQGLEPTRWRPEKAVPFAFNAAVVVLAAPLVEELTFRGVGFALVRPLSTAAALVVTAAAFAAGHGLVEGFPALFLFGLAVAVVRLRTESVYPGMLMHACFNGLALLSAFAR